MSRTFRVFIHNLNGGLTLEGTPEEIVSRLRQDIYKFEGKNVDFMTYIASIFSRSSGKDFSVKEGEETFLKNLDDRGVIEMTRTGLDAN